MLKVVSDRLNQVPEKNFLAFLDLIGGELKPPQPAKVPLTFYLAEGSPTDGLVPAHTQISAPPAEGSDEEIVFETDRELVVTTTELKAVFVREPSQDKYSDLSEIRYAERTLEATGKKDAAFLAFTGDRPIPHSLYISCPEIFNLPELKQLKLTIVDSTNQFQNLPLNWSYWDGSQWEKLEHSPKYENNQFIFTNLPIPSFYKINEQTARCLQASLTNISSLSGNLPQVTNIQGSITVTQSNLIPEVCLFNATPLDISKDFYPFGEQPELNDTFYIALHDTFIKPNVKVTFDIILSRKPINTSNLKISWEIGNGQVWEEIAATANNNQISWIADFSALQFTNKNTIQATLQFPEKNLPSPSSVNGKTRYWIRARIIDGHYGKAASERTYPIYDDLAVIKKATTATVSEIEVDTIDLFKQGDKIRIIPLNKGFSEENQIKEKPENNKLILNTPTLNSSLEVGTRIMRKAILIETIPQTYDPPLIKSLKLSYDFTVKEQAIYSAENDFIYTYVQPQQSFQPFVITEDKEPTLYLGFDQSFENKTVTLYAQVEPPLPNELSDNNLLEKPQLVWDYSSTFGWQRLGVKDETQAFFQRGLIQFVAPADFSQKETFGKQLYWLRVRWVAGNFRVKPRLRRLLTNTTWAVQAISLQAEVLGSSNYEANQVFVAKNTPILSGQQLEVQEVNIPSQIEPDLVKVIRDNLGEIEEIWVVWQEVPDFYGSSASDRHYILDRQTGEIRFGNGQAGMIPPRGRNNIRLSFYRTGGGKQGNVSAQTISQLKTTIPYIDRVINLEAAAGGAEQETLDRLKQRVPKQLRHRDRAVTIEDFADLAYEASTEVARVKVITPDLMTVNFSSLTEDFWLEPTKADVSFADKSPEIRKKIEEINQRAGQVKLIILPHSSDRQPTPSLALLEQVETYIRSRCAATVDLLVTAPKWQEVTVTATITPVSLESADLVRNSVRQRLETFLHPLTGGRGEGWQFGRYPKESDIYAIIQSIPGVDHVNSVELVPKDTDSSLSADCVIYSGQHNINLS
ncbi:putative baseplate assembly protein [Nostoc sp. FACHB-110]|nr:putative baseplate assembly protein [Nostoc sp. FACHB-110]